MREWLDRIRDVARFPPTVLLDRIATWFMPVSRKREGGDGRRELLVVRTDAIGDFILWLDSFRRLREFYPPDDWRITLVGNQAWRDLAEALPYADDYWFIDVWQFRRSQRLRRELFRKMRRRGFDIAISPAYSRRALTADSVCGRSGARERIAYDGGHANTNRFERLVTDRWFTRLVPSDGGVRHELERNAAFMSGLTGEPVEVASGMLPGLPEAGVDAPQSDYFVVFPGASDTRKQWPPEKMAALVERIFQRTGWLPVALGGGEDVEAAQAVISLSAGLPWVNRTGQTNLRDTAALIAGARYSLSNDSMAVHLSVCVGTPASVVMGGGHFGEFLPYPENVCADLDVILAKMPCYGCNWRCGHEDFDGSVWPCVATAEAVDTVSRVALAG